MGTQPACIGLEFMEIRADTSNKDLCNWVFLVQQRPSKISFYVCFYTSVNLKVADNRWGQY